MNERESPRPMSMLEHPPLMNGCSYQEYGKVTDRELDSLGHTLTTLGPHPPNRPPTHTHPTPLPSGVDLGSSSPFPAHSLAVPHGYHTCSFDTNHSHQPIPTRANPHRLRPRTPGPDGAHHLLLCSRCDAACGPWHCRPHSTQGRSAEWCGVLQQSRQG